MQPLLDRVRQTIRRFSMAGPETRVVLALSGGPDSVALAHLLLELDAAGDLQLTAIAHFNHQLRPAADSDERFCRELAASLNRPLLVDGEDVASRARRDRRSIEDAARTARHAFLERARVHFNADRVALAHTKDDQAETFLLRLLRGAGTRGLASMHPCRGAFIRPVLNCRRAELRAWLASRNIAWLEDESNDDVRIPRNRIRAELLPFLERFNPSIVDVLADEAEITRETWRWMDLAAAPLFSRICRQDEVGRWRIDAEALAQSPVAVARLVVHQAMTNAARDRTIPFAHVEEVLELSRTGGRAVDAPGQRVERQGAEIVLTSRPLGHRGRWVPGRRKPANPENLEHPENFFRYPLSIPGEVALEEAGWVLSAEEARSAEHPLRNAILGNSAVAVVGREHIRGPIFVRNRRPGDRFHPPGLKGSKKLQDFFVDRKVARQQRGSVPLVVDEQDRIVWVAGYTLDEAFRVTSPAEAVIILRLKVLWRPCVNSTLKNLIFWVALVVVGVVIYNVSNAFQSAAKTVDFSQFMALVKQEKISQATITGQDITFQEKDNDSAQQRTYAPPQYEGLANELIASGVRIQAKEATASPWANLLFSWAPMLLIVGFWFVFMRQMQSGGNKALSFGKSKAKLSSSSQKKITFKDVAGVDEAKEELQEIIEFLKEPQKFQKLGGRIPKGVLLMGPPGTGKTLLARAVAGEANVPFFSISGSDFVEMFVGVGASRVRDLFEQGKKNAPCIVFIDEIDAVGRHRGAGLGGGHDEREQTLNQLLVEMDGFESNEGVILVAATNRPDVLDSALLRPGRFDRRIVVNRPDVKGREGILAVHTRKIPMADDVEIPVLARGSAGFSGADLANLVNEAALSAARVNQKVVRMRDFEYAKDKVLMGAERRSMIISDDEKKVTAIHEAGHALLTVLLPHADPIHKVTIIPRGMALGLTQQLPTDEKHNYSRDYLNDQIAILLGGRIAEEITMDSLTTGAGNDLERATDLARRMVCEWGMSDTMGPLTFGKKEEQIFLGREIAQHQDYSEDTALKIDHEVRRFVTNNYDRSHKLLVAHKDVLIKMAEALLTYEVLDADQVRRLAVGLPLEESHPPSTHTPVTDSSGENEARARQKERTTIVPAMNKPLPAE